jgi:hypothetical protein
MAVLVGVMNKKSNIYTRQIDEANLSMENIMLPKDLTADIRDYLIASQSKADQQHELNEFLEMISPNIKLKVSWQIFNDIFNTN